MLYCMESLVTGCFWEGRRLKKTPTFLSQFILANNNGRTEVCALGLKIIEDVCIKCCFILNYQGKKSLWPLCG